MTRDEDTSGLFRQVNEQIRALCVTFRLSTDERLQIVCECARADCAEAIDLTMSEYAEVRSGSSRYAIKPHHPFPQGGEPEGTTDRYWLVVSGTAEEERERRQG